MSTWSMYMLSAQRKAEHWNIQFKFEIRIQHTKQQWHLHMVCKKKPALIPYIPTEMLVLFLFSSYFHIIGMNSFIEMNENVNIWFLCVFFFYFRLPSKTNELLKCIQSYFLKHCNFYFKRVIERITNGMV